MKEVFRSKRFSAHKEALLGEITNILDEYEEQDIKVTLRQLYYQLVSRTLIENKLSEYSKLSVLLTDARYTGRVDWDAIEDRIRVPTRHAEFEDIGELVQAAIYSYRLDRWEGQEHYVELFTEKDALSSVLKPMTEKYHIYFNVNRGYSSATAMYDSSKRFIDQQDEKECILLYLGDHDPSGLDMVRDIDDRLEEFGADVEVIPIALTKDQIEKYNPPPNPAKITDPRAKDYIAQFGGTSWEVDALGPDILHKVVEKTIKKYLDWGMMEEIIEQEKTDKTQLVKLARTIVEEQ